MSIGGTIRRIGYYLRDTLLNPSGTRIHEQWRDIEHTMSNFDTGWLRVQRALDNCLQYAAEKSPFYKGYGGKKLHDFPVMDKMQFIKHYDEIKSVDFKEIELHKSSTSGSTGTPFVVLQNRAKRNRVLAELQYWGERVGYRSHEKMIFFRASHPVPFWSMFWSNVWQYDIASMKKTRAEELFKLQSRKHPRALIAYASTFDYLVANWLEEGKTGAPSVRTVFSGSEVLTLTTRDRIEQFWPNAKAYSRYSNIENGMLAQECGEIGVFEICWASYYIEVLKFEVDEPAPIGELGRIVVTDLYNQAFPMIRYDTGDCGSLEYGPDGWLRLTNLTGRRVDFIYDTNGEICSPHLITNTLWGCKDILQYQFIQTGEKTYEIAYVAKDKKKAEEALSDRLISLKAKLGKDAQISLNLLTEIPVLASGKRKSVVQRWKINHSQTK